jgi:hypothetical protein
MVPPRSELALRFWMCRRVFPFGDQRDHRVRAAGLELGAVGVGQAGHVARELDGGHLHAQADAQVGHLVLAGKAGGAILPSMPRLPKPPGTRMASYLASCDTARGDGFRVDVVDLHAHMVLHAGVAQRLVERLVAVGQVHVLAAPWRW